MLNNPSIPCVFSFGNQYQRTVLSAFIFTRKNNTFSLIANFLEQHTFYNTTSFL